ncbi:MAG: glutaredoxin family protein [Gammaproteobacteria bacterium]|nr:glutaredoxin family protein [Gammaproteobacteria bacterium]
MRTRRLILLFALLPGTLIAGEIHQWRDASRQIHFGDKPPEGAGASPVTVTPNVYSAPAVSALAPRASSPVGAARQSKVVLYSTAWCGYCARARAYFWANQIAFTEYDVETTAKGKRDYKRLNGKGVPVILVGQKRLNGFNIDSFEAMYRPW